MVQRDRTIGEGERAIENATQLAPGGEKEFIRLLREYMAEKGIESPNQLYREFKGRGPGGRSPSRAIIHSYFEGTNAPQRWFVRGAFEILDLNQRKRCLLALSYVEDYP